MAFAGKPQTLEVEKIIIRDSHGHARITIGTPAVAGVAVDLNANEPAIWLSDEKGSTGRYWLQMVCTSRTTAPNRSSSLAAAQTSRSCGSTIRTEKSRGLRPDRLRGTNGRCTERRKSIAKVLHPCFSQGPIIPRACTSAFRSLIDGRFFRLRVASPSRLSWVHRSPLRSGPES